MKARKDNFYRARTASFGAAASLFRSALHRVPAFLALLAIVIQSLVVQAHVHGFGALNAAQSAAAIGLALPAADPANNTADLPRGKLPGGDDPSNCRLCQELVHAGRFVTPSAALLIVPLVITLWLLVLSKTSPVPMLGAHIWRSRAPPSHS